MTDLNHIGTKIKEIRKRKKISQEKLAELVSMNNRSILRIENQQNLPTLETLAKIAAAKLTHSGNACKNCRGSWRTYNGFF